MKKAAVTLNDKPICGVCDDPLMKVGRYLGFMWS